MRKIIKNYLSTPYQHNGRDLNGLDCLGLVSNFLADNGVELPSDDKREIKKKWYESEPKRFIKGLQQHANKIDYDNRQPLDVVVFVFNKVPTHAGVLVSRSQFIHVLEGRKVSLARLNRWKSRLHSIWRVR